MLNYSKIGSLTQATRVSVISESNGWSKINYNGKVGYVSSQYLSKISSNPTPETNKPGNTTPSNPTPDNNTSENALREVNTSILNVRSGAGTSYSKLGKLEYKEKVTVLSTSNGWSKINYNGKTGYSLASYLSTSKPSAGASYVAVPAQTTTYGYETYYVVNCKQSITLRTSPSTEAGEICQIPLGSAVSYISAASNGFYYISYNGKTGYALASYLSSSSGGSYYDTCRVVNCKQSITLRPGPDVDSGEICQIPLGATVSFVGTAANDFYEIYYMGNHGYALASYLEFQ